MSDDAIVTFIRIPKNASTSLYSFFGTANTVRNEYLSADNPKHLGIFESSHQSISELQHNLGSYILEKPVLAVVRNPFDRLVSMYFFAKKHDLGKIYDIDTKDFLSFARGFHRFSKDENFFHAIPQVKFMEHDLSYRFTVIRFEDLKAGIRKFIKDYDLDNCFDADNLETLNGTDHCHYSDYYDDETKEIVKDMWGCDLTAFSYSFQEKGHR
jgi:hypothetical protein